MKNVETKKFILSKSFAPSNDMYVTAVTRERQNSNKQFSFFWAGGGWGMVSFCVILYATKPCVFYNQDAVFFKLYLFHNRYKQITLPLEMRRKQRNIYPYNNVIVSLDYISLWDVVPWTFTSLTKLRFIAVDAFVTQYYTKMVCTAFLLWIFCVCTAYTNLADTFLKSFPSKNSDLSSMLEA